MTHKPRKLETLFFFVTLCLDTANIFAKFHDSILCGTRVMALDLKTDGQGGDNVHVEVYHPPSVKARQFRFS